MDVFGAKWENHTEKILNNWQSTVLPEDTVVIPGDFSWGMNFCSSAEDLRFVHALNGKKIIAKGNHDFWWQTMRKLTAFTEKNGLDTVSFLHNNAYYEQGFIICGAFRDSFDCRQADNHARGGTSEAFAGMRRKAQRRTSGSRNAGVFALSACLRRARVRSHRRRAGGIRRKALLLRTSAQYKSRKSRRPRRGSKTLLRVRRRY